MVVADSTRGCQLLDDKSIHFVVPGIENMD
jgi:hypothetical protein